MSDRENTGPRAVQVPNAGNFRGSEFAGQWLVYDGDAVIAGYGCSSITEEQAAEIADALEHWRKKKAHDNGGPDRYEGDELVTCESCSARVDPKLASLDMDEGVWFCRPCGRKIASEEQKHG